MIKTISLLKILDDTVVDGPGFRISLYGAGCPHYCLGCHNPQSWNPANGTPFTIKDVLKRILQSNSNVTFSGGEPFFQAEAFAHLAKQIKDNSQKSIWCYTGYRFEDLINESRFHPLLEEIDVLVDGPYIQRERDLHLLFRGSRNQRLIDVPASRNAGKVILYEYNPFPHF
ncbi:MAG: anaerobic ribonucleoside-triphosphate reductase activating protein [Bacteroidales bacterium]